MEQIYSYIKTNIGVVPITQVTHMHNKKKVTLKGGHLMWLKVIP